MVVLDCRPLFSKAGPSLSLMSPLLLAPSVIVFVINKLIQSCLETFSRHRFKSLSCGLFKSVQIHFTDSRVWIVAFVMKGLNKIGNSILNRNFRLRHDTHHGQRVE